MMNDRRAAIEELVNKKGTVAFKDLKERFCDVSEMTLRRDLECLDHERRIVRIHGGAKSMDVIIGSDDLFAKRLVSNVEQKVSIAQKAVELIRENEVIYIDSGTTAMELAKLIPDKPMAIFTGSLKAAMELARLKQVEVNVLGGRLNSRSLCASGSRSLDFLSDININRAFFGATGYSDNRGFTCGDESEYHLKKTVAERADKNIVLMDASKLGIASTYTFAAADKIDMVVGDEKLLSMARERLERAGLTVL